MSTEVNPTASPVSKSTEEKVVDTTHQFWSKNSKLILGVLAVLVIGTGAYFAYQNFVKKPAELEANDAIWTAQKNFKTDSFALALNGDGTKNNPGFLKLISKHGGTKAANLAHFYAGACYLQLGDFANAIKQMEEFSTSDNELLIRKYGSLGDAYAETGKNEKAIEFYKKAASTFETDEANSSEYLFRLGQVYDKMGKSKEAIETFTAVKEKFPLTLRANEVDKYLARLGETK
jgi:tetratricopeptide (TPR) repeat protein